MNKYVFEGKNQQKSGSRSGTDAGRNLADGNDRVIHKEEQIYAAKGPTGNRSGED